MVMSRLIGPGSTIGILGAGQLGRMLALVARRMGYRIAVFGGDRSSPCGQVADLVWPGDYENEDQLLEFATNCDVVTYEFENIPAHAAAIIEKQTLLSPSTELLRTAQNRFIEKTALADLGLPTAKFRMVSSGSELARAITDFGGDVILKANTDGYDGKGQWALSGPSDALALWDSTSLSEAIVEQKVTFDFELSVVAGRYESGECEFYKPLLNHHENHILDVSISGSELVTPTIANTAIEIARAVLERFDVVGVLCVELFLTSNGQLVVNEIAPRPHNSGHLTIEAYNCSQFELQLRTICGLPKVPVIQAAPVAAMANLLGQHLPPEWTVASTKCLADVNLHLYGKCGGKTNRKMGHLTSIGECPESVERYVRDGRTALQ